MRKATLTKEQMLDCLLEVFRSKGYDGASVTDLMQAINLQKGSLYHHFPGGKDEMAEAVLAHVEAIFEDMVFRPMRQADSPVLAVAEMCQGIDRYFASGSKACLPALLGLGATRDRFGVAIAHYFDLWLTILAATIARSGIAPERASWMAEQMIADIQGAIVLCRALDQTEPFHRAMQRIKAALPGEGHK